MSTPAIRYLRENGIEFNLQEFETDQHSRPNKEGASYGEAAAEALGVDPVRMFKTLILAHDREHFCAIVPVSGYLATSKMAQTLGVKKVVMARPADVHRVTGYVVGGVSPFGQRKRLATVIDLRALSFETIHVSAGRRGLELEIAPNDLVQSLDARVADLLRAG